MYFVGNIDPNSKYKGSKTGLDRTQIQRLDPDTVLSSKRNIVEEEKFLNKEKEDEDSSQDDEEEMSMTMTTKKPTPMILQQSGGLLSLRVYNFEMKVIFGKLRK